MRAQKYAVGEGNFVANFEVIKIDNKYVYMQIKADRDMRPIVLAEGDSLDVHFTPDKCGCCGREY